MRIEAAFDSLTIASQLEGIDLQPTRGEIHLLAYLASLLSLYARGGEGASDWGYSFAATPGGTPFSDSLHVEIDDLMSRGALTSAGTAIQLTQAGRLLQKNTLRPGLSSRTLRVLGLRQLYFMCPASRFGFEQLSLKTRRPH